MARDSTWFLIPLIAAFLVSIACFYGRENARSKTSPSFLLACGAVLLLLLYMILTVTGVVLPYAGIIYGVVGTVMLVIAVFLFRG